MTSLIDPANTRSFHPTADPASSVACRANVLLVDDQPAKLLTYEAILAGLGVRCVRALSARQALEQLLVEDFAVLILDVHMPEMDGFELAALVREHPRLERVPIIFATGVHISELDQLRGYEVGAIDYISVPVVPEILRSKVALLVELHLKRCELQRLNEELKEARARLESEHARALTDKDAQLTAVLGHPDQFFIVVEAVTDPTGVIRDWRYVNVNDAVLPMLGMQRAEIIGKCVGELFPARREFAAELCLRTLQSHEPVRYETSFNERDLVVTLYAAGPATVVASSFDVTDRKRAERALQANERRNQALLANAPVAIGHFAPEGKFEYANAAYCELVGYSLEELQQLRWQDLTHPADLQIDSALVQRTIKGELPYYMIEKRYIHKDGRIVWVSLFGNFVRDDTGCPVQGVAIAVDITDYKRSLEALSQSEQRLWLAKSAARLGVFDWDLRAGTLTWDERLHELWGTGSHGVVSYDKYMAGVHPDDRAMTQMAVDRALAVAGDGHYSMTYRVINNIDHATRWIDAVGRVTFEHGQPVRFNGIVQDVTERKQAEHRVQESEQRFRNMADHAPVMIWVTDPSGNCLYLNRRWYEFTGQTPAAAHGWGWLDAVHDDDRERVREHSARAHAAHAAFRMEYRLRDRSGQFHWVIDAAAPRMGEGGALVGYIGSVIEITERKNIEDALRESEQRFRELADAMPQIVFTTAADGSTDYFNSKWYELTEISRESLEDEVWTGALHPDDRQRCLDTWYSCVRSGTPYQIEYRLNFPARGGYRWHLGRALPVRDRAGEIVRWYGTCTDIHDLRSAQEALRLADRRKDEFLATLAHELRNPLAPIRSAVEYLRLKSTLDPNLDNARSIIERQTNVMVRLVDDLLDLSRITRGRISLQRETVSVEVPLQSAIDTCRPLVEARRHELVFRPPPEPVCIEADVTRISQVLTNILSNAAKYTPPQGRIEVEVHREGAMAAIAIRDNGEGIPSGMLESIFDMFVQVESTIHRSQGGLGIGLTLARQLVEMHAGRITARSDGPGRGSEFTIHLPLAALSLDHSQASDLPLGRAAIKRRILLADDNLDGAQTLRMLLELLGHEVVTVHDGLEAVRSFATYQPDVVLLDIGMPKLNGYEAAEQIRATPNGKRVALVAISGWGQETDRRAASEAGFNDHLTKPIGLQQLQAVLEAFAAHGGE